MGGVGDVSEAEGDGRKGADGHVSSALMEEAGGEAMERKTEMDAGSAGAKGQKRPVGRGERTSRDNFHFPLDRGKSKYENEKHTE